MDEDSKALVKAAAEVVLQPVAGLVSNTIGALGGDRLDAYRKANRDRWRAYYDEEQAKITQKTPTPDLRMAAEVLGEVQDEGRDELLRIWAKLMASIVDSNKASKCRREFVDIIEQLEPLDAQVLATLNTNNFLSPSRVEFLATSLKVTLDQARLAIRNLKRLDLVFEMNGGNPQSNPSVVPLGRQLLEVVS